MSLSQQNVPAPVFQPGPPVWKPGILTTRPDMGKLRSAGQIRQAGKLLVVSFWPAGTYTNLNSHRELSGRPFFPLEIMDGSDFQENKPQRYKTGIKKEVKTFYFGDLSKASTIYPNLVLRVKSLPLR